MAAMRRFLPNIVGVVRVRTTYQPLERVAPVAGLFPEPTPGAENVRYDVGWAIWANAKHPAPTLSVRSYPVELPPWT